MLTNFPQIYIIISNFGTPLSLSQPGYTPVSETKRDLENPPRPTPGSRPYMPLLQPIFI